MFTATSNGADNLYRVPLAGGTPQLVAQGGAISRAAVSEPTSRSSRRSTLTAPAELFRIAERRNGAGALTHENEAWLKDVDVPEAREPDGRRAPAARRCRTG